jgi:hypothetical protein
MTNDVIYPISGASMEYRQCIQDKATSKTWLHAATNECGCLAQGDGDRIVRSNTINFIPRNAMLQRKTVTYGSFVADICPNNPEVHCIRLTMGVATSSAP